jgi:hypothetical protein
MRYVQLGSLIAAIALAIALPSCGDRSGGNLAADAGAGEFGDDGPNYGDSANAPIHTTYGCPGCPPFPRLDSPQCDPSKLAPPTLAYPMDGTLFPPNLNVLEVHL